jgi:hypothetical protein
MSQTTAVRQGVACQIRFTAPTAIVRKGGVVLMTAKQTPLVQAKPKMSVVAA